MGPVKPPKVLRGKLYSPLLHTVPQSDDSFGYGGGWGFGTWDHSGGGGGSGQGTAGWCCTNNTGGRCVGFGAGKGYSATDAVETAYSPVYL